MNRYYFSLLICFKKEIDLVALEKMLKLEGSKLTPLSESRGLPENKTAKLYFKTKEYAGVYSDDDFSKFVEMVHERCKNLGGVLQEYDGRIELDVVFTTLEEKPCLSLSEKTVKNLSDLGASFDVDFI